MLLVRVPCPDPLLNLWFEVDMDYVDSLISLATRHTGPLDTVLDRDRYVVFRGSKYFSRSVILFMDHGVYIVSMPNAPLD